MPDVVRRVIVAPNRQAQAYRKHELADNLPMTWSEEYEEFCQEALRSRQPSWAGTLDARLTELQRTGARVSVSAQGSHSHAHTRRKLQDRCLLESIALQQRKTDDIRLTSYVTFEEADASIGRFVQDVSNTMRLHVSLGM